MKPAERGSHAVFMACAGVAPAVEADFRAQLAKFSDLKQTAALRNGIFRRLNGGAGAILLRPFVPQAVAVLTEAVERCEQASQEIGTHFARMAIGEVARTVLSVATREVELQRPPARIVATVDERPLPLREVGITCDVLVHLENVSNVGASHVTVALRSDAPLLLPKDPLVVGVLKGNIGVPLAVPLTVLEPLTAPELALEITWRNPDHSTGSAVVQSALEAQAADVDWEAASGREPYAPYPVEEADALVGRSHLPRVSAFSRSGSVAVIAGVRRRWWTGLTG
jgi:hypothetical protein